MGKTSIQWTEHSINPLRARRGDAIGHYCEKISSGCANCYASKLQSRFQMPSFPGVQTVEERQKNDIEFFLDEGKLNEVRRRKKPTTYFWCDMTDILGEWVADEWIYKCFATMALTPQHVHQVLTKRPERLRKMQSDRAVFRKNMVDAISILTGGADDGGHFYAACERCTPMPSNVWLGTSIEAPAVEHRALDLFKCPASVRFISAEPLLDELTCWWLNPKQVQRQMRIVYTEATRLISSLWTIVGGESGSGARTCQLAWIRQIIERCREAAVPVFTKQLGSRPCCEHATRDELRHTAGCRECGFHLEVGPKGGDIDEWPEDLRVREMPELNRS